MFAIAFDLIVEETIKHHPKSLSKAYAEIGAVLASYKFKRIQGSVYMTDSDDMANLLGAIIALKALPWLPHAVRDIRGFKVENWSNFTAIVKGS